MKKKANAKLGENILTVLIKAKESIINEILDIETHKEELEQEVELLTQLINGHGNIEELIRMLVTHRKGASLRG